MAIIEPEHSPPAPAFSCVSLVGPLVPPIGLYGASEALGWRSYVAGHVYEPWVYLLYLLCGLALAIELIAVPVATVQLLRSPDLRTPGNLVCLAVGSSPLLFVVVVFVRNMLVGG